jgi:hypothetical protein
MQIRDIDKSFLPRLRANDKDPVRKTAKELGAFLDKLSEAVKQSHRRFADDDSVDDDTLKKSKQYTRGFNLHPAADEAPLENNLTEDESKALDQLKEARTLAADASLPVLPYTLREKAQERFQEILREISETRVAMLLSLTSTPHETDAANPLFSLATADCARSAYLGVENLITKLFEIGTRDKPDDGADAEQETALNASERLRDFLLNEGPAKSFARFREINLSNVLALLK